MLENNCIIIRIGIFTFIFLQVLPVYHFANNNLKLSSIYLIVIREIHVKSILFLSVICPKMQFHQFKAKDVKSWKIINV